MLSRMHVLTDNRCERTTQGLGPLRDRVLDRVRTAIARFHDPFIAGPPVDVGASAVGPTEDRVPDVIGKRLLRLALTLAEQIDESCSLPFGMIVVM
jgi:hypothetical protein